LIRRTRLEAPSRLTFAPSVARRRAGETLAPCGDIGTPCRNMTAVARMERPFPAALFPLGPPAIMPREIREVCLSSAKKCASMVAMT
jgi:hypothetical protein